MTRLHIVFSHSAAMSLKAALATLGLAERVALLADDFSIGPIAPGDPEQRRAWHLEHLNDDLLTYFELTEQFWAEVATHAGSLLVWMSSRSGRELCGMHALLARSNAPIEVIDVADVPFTKDDGTPAPFFTHAFSVVSDERIVKHALLELATPLDDIERSSLRAQWSKLANENAALRVVTDSGLVSQPIDYFDDRIRSSIEHEWQRIGRVVGRTLETMYREDFDEFHSDYFVFTRILDLLDVDETLEGRTERDDGFWTMHESWIRRRPTS